MVRALRRPSGGMRRTTSTSPERLTYSVATAAEMLGISRALAYELVRSGDIPSLKLGRRVVVPCAALTEMLDVQPPSGGSHLRPDRSAQSLEP